jgi:hypothetical protein
MHISGAAFFLEVDHVSDHISSRLKRYAVVANFYDHQFDPFVSCGVCDYRGDY